MRLWLLMGGILAFTASAVCACGTGSSPQGGGDHGTGPSDAAVSMPAPEASVVGALDGAPATNLPPLPELTNVIALERDDSVGIDFDPVDDAVDYRVYVLPQNADVTAGSDGSITVRDAVYRCAGLRQAYNVPTNINSTNTGDGVYPSNDGGGVIFQSIYPSITAEVSAPTILGYAYATAAAGRLPVYAIGVHPSPGEQGWQESRAKIYTTSATARSSLIATGGRDDGIVFYIPESAGSDSVAIYHSENVGSATAEYYLTSKDLAAHASDTTPPSVAFHVLGASSAGAAPLQAVLYQPAEPHIELSLGGERFKRAANQGRGPLWHLEWSGITGPTILVVEALASGCPFQGFLSAEHLDAPPHQPFYTLAELKVASPTGEVFVNGQYDVQGRPAPPSLYGAALLPLVTPNASPVPIARSFVRVQPKPHVPADWDFYQGFGVGETFGPVTPATWDSCPAGDSTCGRWTSPAFDVTAFSIDNPSGISVFTFGAMLGQFWDAFDDWQQDVTGRVRFTARTPASIDADASEFLHVTWSVDTVSTGRRYPQLIVTDQPAPVDDGFKNPDGNFLLIQTIQGPSMRLEAEAFHGLVNGNPWAVNNQAPDHALIDYDDPSMTGSIPPAPSPFEHASMDRMTKYDAYISSSRIYVLVDDLPAACMRYPTNGFALGGSVSVTFGDVLYHEGAETEVAACRPGPTAMPFLFNHQCTETKRHWDDLAFKSGAPAPAWDLTRFPCEDY
jgi:hypothetical protein